MKRILVVEDNRRIREGLLTLVERAGFQVAGAGDFDGAAELLRSERFDLLITDLDLPGGTGLDLVRQAKAFYPQMASILVTAIGGSEVRKQAQELELAGYFEKPYDPEALMSLVRSSIDSKRKLSARSARSG
jgi:DNA-binding NtrC family response regulator